MRTHHRFRSFLGLAAVAMVLALASCTTDSPTEPQQQPVAQTKSWPGRRKTLIGSPSARQTMFRTLVCGDRVRLLMASEVVS